MSGPSEDRPGDRPSDRPRPRPRPAPAPEPVGADPVRSEAVETDAVESGSTGASDVEAAKAEPMEADAPAQPAQRTSGPTSGRGSWVAVGVAVLLVALVVLDVLLVLRYRDNADANRRADRRNARSVATTYRAALAAAATKTPQILSYGYRTIDADIARATGDLTGQFRTDYSKLLGTTVKPAAVSGRITTTARAMGTAVIDAAGPRTVSVLVFVDQQTTSGAAQTPQVNGTRVQVVMTEVGRNWLISNLTPV